MVKIVIVILFCFSFFVVSSQNDEKPPAFLDPKIDTSAFVNCTEETLQTIIAYIKRNPKFIIDNGVACTAKVYFTINPDFSISVKSNEIFVNLAFKDKKGREYASEIKKYYEEQSAKIARNMYGLFIPTRVKGQYSASKFYINIDFTKGDESLSSDSVKSRTFDINELSYQTNLYNSKLREKGIEMLKVKKPELAFIYFRMAYFINKDVDAVVLLGNLWDVMGEPDTACKHWRQAMQLGSKQAEDLVKKCSQ